MTAYRGILREKGTTQQKTDFFRVQFGHKGNAALKFEALSSACQIVNERLMKCVQPAQKKQSRAHAFKQIFSNLIMQPYNAKVKTYSPTFVE
jgi:hypothetical protein